MKRTVLTAIVLSLFALATTTGCPSEKKAETNEPEKTEAEAETTEEGEEGEDEAEDEGDDEAAAEDDEGDDEEGDDEGGEEEEAKVDAEPGQIPFEYPKVATNAKAGEFILAPPRDWIDKGFQKGGDKQTFIFYSAEMVEPGDVNSKVKKIGKEEMIPNSLIIPIAKGAKANKGDILLTWWQSGSGMKRAIVVGGSDTEPTVRYLDVDLDNPSGLGTKEDTLKPDSFAVLTKEWEPGTAVAIKSGSSYKHGIIVNKAEGKVLTVGFAGRMAVTPEADVTALPVMPEVKKGQKVWVPFVGSFREAEVQKVDPKIGRVFVKFQFAGKDKEQAVPFGNVALSLDGETPTAAEEPAEEPEEEKKKVSYDGLFRGKVTGTQGIRGQVMLSIKGNKVTGNLKGTRGKGERWNTGFSGSRKGTKVSGAGRNKNTTLSLTGAIRNPKEVRGTFSGNVNGKKAKMTFTARR